MSMWLHSILQCAEVSAAYFAVTLLYPYIIMRRVLPDASMPEKIMACFMAGNAYLQAVVCILELLHISCRFSLILCMLLPAVIVYRKELVAFAKLLADTLIRLGDNVLGYKRLMLDFSCRTKRFVKKKLPRGIRAGVFFELVPAVLAAGTILYFYGTMLTQNYGYTLSDVPTHSKWIAGLCENRLYCDGIYPQGYHWTVYFLHAVFGFPIYTILRVFFVVQICGICAMMLCFLKALCRSRYIPYLSVIVYTGSSLFAWISYGRLYASLPQEFGMLFLLPVLYFALRFFRQYAEKGEPGSCLVFFAIAFSLTVSAHFYVAMIAGILCVGVAAGYCFRFWRWGYFRRILCAGVVGLLIAAAPMAVCYAAGTPMQESLGWAVNIIKSTDNVSVLQDAPAAGGTDTDETAAQQWGRAYDRIEAYSSGRDNPLNGYGFPLTRLFIISIAALIFLGCIFIFIPGERDRGACLLAVGTGEALLLLLMCMDVFGLPKLMEVDRTCIFFVYLLPVIWCLLLDAGVYLVMNLFAKILFRCSVPARAFGAVSFAAVGSCVWLMTGFGIWRDIPKITGLETNGAMICVENIVNTEKEKSWTVCSDTDELYMCKEYGFHYDVIQFLWDIYGKTDGMVTIPTEKVFFFIEKIPIDYSGSGGGDIPVSDAYAAKKLPEPNYRAYKGENRLVTMSHLYCWARKFAASYPNEMSVYYEDDQFVCYMLKQNTYSLYDLGIEYAPGGG